MSGSFTTVSDMAVMSRATLVALCGLALSANFYLPAAADQGLLIWSASKGGENTANFRAGIALPFGFDPTLTALTTIAGREDGSLDPAKIPFGIAASMRLTSPRAMEYGRLSRLEMRVDARARSGALELHDSDIWKVGGGYELRGSRVLTARTVEGERAGFIASQAIELDLDRFGTTLSTRAHYELDGEGPETSFRLTRRFGETFRIGVSLNQPFRQVRPSFDARYTRSW